MANLNEIYFTIEFLVVVVIFVMKLYNVLMGGGIWDSKDERKNIFVCWMLFIIYLLMFYWGFSMWLIDVTNQTLQVSLTFEGMMGILILVFSIVESVQFAEVYTRKLETRMGTGRDGI